ncbi:hypothetical protein CSA37_00275 [Candidatus Fermentibacteria bacterium]|nr:MAG: hypothetical protein CSA37_00275 [Candidatus Fermentibacteria bacterium]
MAYGSKNCYGHIDEEGIWASNGVDSVAHAYDPFDLQKCRECIQLPICMGGCAKSAIDKSQTAVLTDSNLVMCHAIFSNMEDMVRLYLESSRKEKT